MGQHDPVPGPIEQRSLPLAGAALFSAILIVGTGWMYGRRYPGNGAASPPCPGGPNR